MRITENMMMNTYTRNLQTNASNFANSNMKIASNRKYNHVSEDPATAAKAFSIRDQLAKTEEHIKTVENASSELESAGSNIQILSSIFSSICEKGSKVGNSSNDETINAIIKEFDGIKNELLHTMNTKYGDKYLFSGSANGAPPFTLDADGKLLFNGKSVDAYDKADPDTYFPENKDIYLDIGFGSFLTGINTDRAGVKISTSGVDVLGYGKDENGVPNNLFSLVTQAQDQLKAGNKDDFLKTLDHLKQKKESVTGAISEIGTRQQLLERAENRLETGLLNLQKNQQSLEGLELEKEVINNKSFESAWMVTLQMGSSIIPPSIFDFMK